MHKNMKLFLRLGMVLALVYCFADNKVFASTGYSETTWGNPTTPPIFPEAKRDPRTRPGYEPFFHDSSHSFDVRFYTLKLLMPMTGPAFSGRISIICTSNENGLTNVSLDCVELTVDSVHVDGTPAVYDTGQGKIDITLGPYTLGQNFEISVDYNGIANTQYGGYWFPVGLSWFHPGSASTPETTAFSMAEPSDARKWFPCFDEPWDKADSSKIDCVVPIRFQVASNGLLTDVDTVSTWAIYHWSELHPISTYLMSVAISKYAILNDQAITTRGDTIPIMHFVYHEDSAEAVAGYAEVPDMVEFYADTFYQYPFEKYGMAVVSPFGGGMEHQSMTTILDYYSWEEGIVHELCHMWWGDMITCADWPNIWINEGFATYGQALWTEHHYGTNAFRNDMQDKMNSYFNQAASYDFPIYDPPINELFNYGIVYAKGACILHMLRYVLGEDDFWGMWPVYADSFKYGNANTPDFQRISEQVSGQNLDWFFQQWVYDLGYPHYQYGWRAVDLGSNQYQLDVQVRQTQSQGPIFRIPIEFRFTAPSVDTTLVGLDSLEFQEFQFTMTLAQAPNALSFDPDNWITDAHTQVPYNGVISNNGNPIPIPCRLGMSYPNPMTHETRIDFSIPQQGKVQLAIYNILGQQVKELVNGILSPGYHSVTWHGQDEHGKALSAGVYFCKMKVGAFETTSRITLIH